MAELDQHQRPLQNLRVSVTDRCNLRCRYCMPEHEYAWIPREQILRFEEISALVDAFAALGVRKVRLTGGEPLLRRDLPELVSLLAVKPAITDLALTTNGVTLDEQALALHVAGLHRATVSLDSLRADRYQTITGSDALGRVFGGIDAARAAGLELKLNTVVLRGLNDDELVELIEYGGRVDAEVRFIEYMDVGGATRWHKGEVFSRDEMLARLSQHYGPIEPMLGGDRRAPAERYRLPDGRTFGIIASTTTPFCGACDRARLTADGMLYLCLYATRGVSLRDALRTGCTADALGALIAGAWRGRTDRGAEQRLSVAQRGAFVPIEELRADYHLEMHKRGG